MVKLFALEDDKPEKSNELIIDKLLEKAKEKPSPLSLTADLLKQRDQVNKEVEEHLDKKDEDEEEDEDSEDNSEEESEDDDKKSDDDGDEEESEEDEKEEDDVYASNEEKDKSEEKDDDKAAEDEDDLKGLIGSGLKGKDDDSEDKKEEKDKSVSSESLTEKKPRQKPRQKPLSRLLYPIDIFAPLMEKHQQRRISLEEHGLGNQIAPVDKQPVAYVKEEIVSSITNLTKMANSYADNIKSSVETYSKSIIRLNESLTVFNQLVDNGKYHFTHKIVKDRDILSAISFKDKSDPRETYRVLNKYLTEVNAVNSLVMNNSFAELKAAYTAKDFTEDNGVLMYGKQLPGFTNIGVSIVQYESYIKTKLTEFHFYEVKSQKLEDLYALDAVSITEDGDLDYIVKALNDLIIQAGVSTDTLKGINENFITFVNELKVLAYDVENNKYNNMTELGIDEKIQDFIRFKLVMEACYISIGLVIKYITSMTSALNICLELKE